MMRWIAKSIPALYIYLHPKEYTQWACEREIWLDGFLDKPLLVWCHWFADSLTVTTVLCVSLHFVINADLIDTAWLQVRSQTCRVSHQLYCHWNCHATHRAVSVTLPLSCIVLETCFIAIDKVHTVSVLELTLQVVSKSLLLPTVIKSIKKFRSTLQIFMTANLGFT